MMRIAGLLLTICLLGVGHCKTIVHYSGDSDSSQDAPKIHVGTDGVSASFGGYSASAGLGGKVGDSGTGGVLFARAGAPGGVGASAGLGGSVQSGGQPQGGLYAGATTGGSSSSGVISGSGSSVGVGSDTSDTPGITIRKPRPNPNLYNDIFNIPTSILRAVNRLINNGSGGVHAETNKDVGTRVGAGAFVETGNNGNAGGAAHAGTNLFNDIFNIPISALNAVNQLLNNNANAKSGK